MKKENLEEQGKIQQEIQDIFTRNVNHWALMLGGAATPLIYALVDYVIKKKKEK